MGWNVCAVIAALLALSACVVTAEPAPGTADLAKQQTGDAEAQLPEGWAFAGGGSSFSADDTRHMISAAEEMMKSLCATPAGSGMPSCRNKKAVERDGTAGITSV
mmetsp:Transcript_13750/g.18591  ORF Transcript_13750/g.18591 Transcript_13750/m.18591 type:complete len:105 (-) Transcript_13750:84-398(-)